MDRMEEMTNEARERRDNILAGERLLKAAPALLAALERASACMARIGSHVPANERDTFTATHDAVYAAIAQARGEQ